MNTKLPFLLLVAFTLVIASCRQDSPQQTSHQHFLQFDSTKVYYEAWGEGERNLVFIHGWGLDVQLWQHQIAHFSQQSKVILIDLPGHGKSSKPKLDYTMDFYAQSIHRVLEELKITEPILIGHSMGHPIIRQLIRNYPKLQAKFCIVDGAYFKIPKDSIPKAQYIAEMEGFAALFTGDNKSENTTSFIQSLFVKETPEEVKNYTLSTMGKAPEHVGYNTMIHLIKEEIWKEDPIDIPTLAIYANIPELPDDNEAYLRSLYPKLDYQVIDQVGHFLMMEAPDQFNAILDEFINKE